MNYGFFRVAAAAPRLRVADPDYNAGQLETVIDRAVAQQVRLLVTPELSVTGYTCADLFFTAALQQAADLAVQRLAAYTAGKDIAVLIGAPVPCCSGTGRCRAWCPRCIWPIIMSFTKSAGSPPARISIRYRW